MKIKKLVGCLLPLYLIFSPSASKAETRTYSVDGKSVMVEVGVGMGAGYSKINFKVEYETISNLSKIKGPLDKIQGKVESLSLNPNSDICIIIPKAIRINYIQQEAEFYNVAYGNRFSRVVPPPTKLERALEEMGTELFLTAIGAPSIATMIGEHLKHRSEQKRKEFINKLAEQEKGYAVCIEINPCYKDLNDFELGRSFNIDIGISDSMREVLNETNIGKIEGKGSIYFKLYFDRNETLINDNIKLEDKIPFFFRVYR